jgi:hypothetical protein
MKYASFGTISHATLRNEDLIDAFTSELEYQVRRNAEEWRSDDGRKERDRILDLIAEAREPDYDYDSDEACEIVNELQDALDAFAPPYGYFGTHEGDGSDFGYWISSDAIDLTFDGLKVNDTSEVPEEYSGEVLHVNDHGNYTLYAANKGKLTEVWSVV